MACRVAMKIFLIFLFVFLASSAQSQPSPVEELNSRLSEFENQEIDLEKFSQEVIPFFEIFSEKSELKDLFDVSEASSKLQILSFKIIKQDFLKEKENLVPLITTLVDNLKKIYPVASPFIFKLNKYKNSIIKTIECENKKDYPDCIWEIALDSENLGEEGSRILKSLSLELSNQKIDTLKYLLLSIAENDYFKVKENTTQCRNLELFKNKELIFEDSLTSDILIKRILALEKSLNSNSQCRELVNQNFPLYAVQICERGFIESCKSAIKILKFSNVNIGSLNLVRKAFVFSGSGSENDEFKEEVNKEFLETATVKEKIFLLFKGELPSKVYYFLFALLFITVLLCCFLYFAPNFLSSFFIKKNKPEQQLKPQEDSKGYLQMTEKLDEYSTLLNIFGLNDEASNSDIKKAYRQLVKQLHPDSSDVLSQKEFERVQQAYDRLMEIRQGWFGLSKD
jgi:hypothetical protein